MSALAAAASPSIAAHRLTHVLNAYALAHGTDRFPVEVEPLAREASNIFGWDDSITEIRAADIPGFEGALLPDESRSRWLLLYNSALRSRGRIRFTQAHELGHYLLHRLRHARFECTVDDVIGPAAGGSAIEAEADSFAAQLLMPLDDFRAQTADVADFEMLGQCAERYGVSLTAAVLRWLEYTAAAAVLVVHRDGFMRWAKSSRAAMKAGAFFATRRHVIEVPAATLAAREEIGVERIGVEVRARDWFPHAPSDASLVEMKIVADAYEWTMTLLVLPRGLSVWPPR